MYTKQRNGLFLIFTLAGFSGLIYESIWTHYLKLFLGHAAYAQTLVLAIFMGGMSLGAWICSRYSRGWKNLLLGYAVTEGAIGLSALAFHPIFDRTIQFAYTHVLPNLGSPLTISLFKWTLSSLMILPQTILLGMTFPLMTAGVIRLIPEDSGKSISMLYFTNSFGAAVGVLVSGFVLIRLTGLPGTIRIAGLINIALSLCVWLLARGLPALSPPEPDSPSGEVVSGWFGIMMLVAMVTGAASFIYEIGWIRMLSLVLGSSTHAFELMLSAFILGLAFGGLWIQRRIQRIGNTIRFLAAVQIIMGFLALLTLPLYGNTFVVMQWIIGFLEKSNTGYTLFNGLSSAIAIGIMFPATFCAGMTLPLITYSLIRKGCGERSIGAVYAANSVGAILGVFFAIHVGMPGLGLKGLMMVGGGLDMALGVALLWKIRSRPEGFRVPSAATAFSLGLLILCGGFVRLDPYLMGSGVYRRGTLKSPENSRLIFHKDGKTATVSLLLEDQGLSIRTNGKPDAQIQIDPFKRAARDESTMILAAALPMALYPEARTVANIGFGSGVTTATFLTNTRLERVDTIEIEPVMVEGASNFGPLVEADYRDPRSRIHIDDAKTYFSARKSRYDIIVSEPSNPWVSGVAGLFSEEFYRLVGRHLTPGGLFCQWLQLYEIDVDLVVSVMKALSASFTDFVIYASVDDDFLIIARNGGPLGSPDFSSLAYPALEPLLKRIRIESEQDLAIRKVSDKRQLKHFLELFSIPANSDYYPVLDQEAARTRFLQVDATELVNFARFPLPLYEVLSGTRMPWRSTTITPSPDFNFSVEAYSSMAIRDYILTGQFGPRYEGVPEDAKRDAIDLKELFSGDCGADPQQRVKTLFAVVGIRMVPFLRPEELDRVWSVLESGSCAASFGARERAWITLYKALGRRDGEAMAKGANEILVSERFLPSVPTNYLIVTGMLGHILQEDFSGSLQFWQEYGKRAAGADQPTRLFQLLYAMSEAQ